MTVMKHDRIHVDPEMPSHDAEGMHVEMAEMNGGSLDEWRTTISEDKPERPSNEKLLVSSYWISCL